MLVQHRATLGREETPRAHRSASSERRAARTGRAWAVRGAEARAGAGRDPNKYVERLDGGAAAARAPPGAPARRAVSSSFRGQVVSSRWSDEIENVIIDYLAGTATLASVAAAVSSVGFAARSLARRSMVCDRLPVCCRLL